MSYEQRRQKKLSWLQYQNRKTLQSPEFSPDVAPGEFRLFPALKRNLGRQKFEDSREVETSVAEWRMSTGNTEAGRTIR